MKKKMVEDQVENKMGGQELTEEGVSRRNFLKGMALGAAGISLAGILPGYVFADVTAPVANGITRGEFVAKISNYFAWPHPTEYNDIWKAPLKQFADVKADSIYARQIDTAYEEGIIDGVDNGKFNPNAQITRQDAAVIFTRAFHLVMTDKTGLFTDEASIASYAKASVNTMAALGFISGAANKQFAPYSALTKAEFDSILNKITSTMVTPVQALPKTNSVAPRRYIKLYSPTPGARIYFTKTTATDLASLKEPEMPNINDPAQLYTVEEDGYIKEDYTKQETTYVTYKAVAAKDGMAVSPVSTFTWHLYRPKAADYGYIKIQDKTATSPAVYEIWNDSDSVRPMAWYIEGQNKGVMFDALRTPIEMRDLKEFTDKYLATKPYILIIGHSHTDHVAQLMNFLKAGIEVYANERGFLEIATTYVTKPEDQAKIKKVEEGDVFDLGGVKLNVYALPGHSDSLVILQDKKNGLIFATDIYGCTRAGSADNVGVTRGMRADLLLSLTQQTYSNYLTEGGKTTKLFTGHDEYPLTDINLKLFEQALQQVVDKGEAACSPTLRGGNNPVGSRTTMVGDMWKDGTNWISLLLEGKMGDNTEYLSSTTNTKVTPYMEGNKDINYNGGSNFMKYSVLSNIEITGGTLVGKTLEWTEPTKPFSWAGKEIVVKNALPNKLNPWAYDYTINVPKANSSITIVPATMSTKVTSITLNGKDVGYKSSNKVDVKDGTVITIKVVAPDKVTTSTYTFTVAMK